MLVSNLALGTAGMVKVLHSFTFPALLSARFDTNIKFLNLFNHQLLIQTTLDIFERLVMKDVQNFNSGIKPCTRNSWESKSTTQFYPPSCYQCQVSYQHQIFERLQSLATQTDHFRHIQVASDERFAKLQFWYQKPCTRNSWEGKSTTQFYPPTQLLPVLGLIPTLDF